MMLLAAWRTGRRSRLARNIAISLVGQLALLVLVLIAARLVFRRLGDDALGLIMFSQAIGVILIAAAELGIGATTVREVAAHGEADPGYIRALIRTFSLLYWALYATLVLVMVLLSPLLIRQWVHLEALSPTAVAAPFRLLMAAALLGLPRSLYASLFRGHQRLGLTNATDVAAALVQQAGMVLILVRGSGLLPLSAWILTSALFPTLGYALLAGRSLGWSALLPGWSWPVLRRNLRFSLHLASISLLGVAHTQADRLVVSKLLPLGSLGIYSVASNLLSRATLPVTAMAEAAFPSLAKLVAAHDRPGWQRQYAVLQRLVAWGTLPVYAALVFAVRPLFGYVFGPGVASTLLLPVLFLCAGWYMNGTLMVPYLLSLAMGKPEIAARQNLLALLIVLPVSVACVAAFGLTGAGLSWFAYHCFAYAYGGPRLCREVIEISPIAWYGEVLEAAGSGAVLYGATWLVITRWLAGNPLAMVAGFALASTLYVLAGWRLPGTMRGIRVGDRAGDMPPARRAA
jgi:O-antigen/teichoic acid export membrane protein